MNDRIVLAGGSGFLGRHLAAYLAGDSADVVVLTRSPERYDGAGRAVAWDGETVGAWVAELEGARAVVNLAGRNVDCRYNEQNRREIDDSRVNSVRAIAAALSSCDEPPAVWVQAASLAIYGDAGEQPCDEDAPTGSGTPVETCLVWERAWAEAQTPRTRSVLLRISFVLGPGGGALRRLAGLTRAFLGGTVGHGRQYISWLHVRDLNRIIRWAIETPSAQGVYNATGPNPVPNRVFMAALRRALGRPWSPPAPALLVRLGCWLMRTEPVLALTGRRGTPRRLTSAGFAFELASLEEALADIYG